MHELIIRLYRGPYLTMYLEIFQVKKCYVETGLSSSDITPKFRRTSVQ